MTGASTLAFAGCRIYAHRLGGYLVDSDLSDDTKTSFTIKALPYDDSKIEAWIAKTSLETAPPIVEVDPNKPAEK